MNQLFLFKMLNIVVYNILFLLYILLLCYNKLNNGKTVEK